MCDVVVRCCCVLLGGVETERGVSVTVWWIRNRFFWEKLQQKKLFFPPVSDLWQRSHSVLDISSAAAGVMSEHALFTSSRLGKVVFFVKWCELRSHLAGSLGTPPSPSSVSEQLCFQTPHCFVALHWFFSFFFFFLSPFPTSVLWSLRDYPERDSQGSVRTS